MSNSDDIVCGSFSTVLLKCVVQKRQVRFAGTKRVARRENDENLTLVGIRRKRLDIHNSRE